MVLIYTIPASSSSSGFTANSVHYENNTTNGAYYGWGVATAGTQGSSYSICPKGWRLPTKAEYDNFLTKASIGNNSTGSSKIRGVPYNFPFAGYVNGVSLSRVGSDGRYWSGTAYGSNQACYLSFGSSGVYTDNDAGRSNGFSVRCIAP